MSGQAREDNRTTGERQKKEVILRRAGVYEGVSQTQPARTDQDFPAEISAYLQELVSAASKAFGADLESVLVFGSGAEGRLRITSDLNVMCVLKSFSPQAADAMRPLLRQGHSLCRLRVLFILGSEIAENAHLFALKFSDIKRRHKVLFGSDPTAAIQIDRAALVLRLRQTLANLKQRSRAVYALDGDNAQRLTLTIADMAGPLRSAAAAVLGLAGQELPPKEALQKIALEAGISGLEDLSRAREQGGLSLSAAKKTHQALSDLCSHLIERLARESV